MSAEAVLALYRVRWQIECAFKQLKSQLDLDRINAFDPDLVTTYLLCKLLGVLLLEDLACRWFSFSPEDYDNEYPVNKWRVWTSLWRVLVSSLEMTVSLLDWETHGHLYRGYYHDSRRKRQKQNLSQILNLTMRPLEA